MGLSEIRLVLSARPSHRDPTAASLAHRWRMLCLACEIDARLVADDREVRRDRPSFTVETLADIRIEAGDEPVVWVIGSDALVDLPSWYRWREVLELCNLVVLERPGFEADYPAEVRQLVQDRASVSPPAGPSGQIFFLPEEMQRVSASDIRRELSLGHDAGHLLNTQVATYISQQGLYGVTRDG